MLKEFNFRVTQAQIDPTQLGAQMRAANIRGFTDGIGINHDFMQVQLWAAEDLTSAEIATVESILVAYVYVPPPPPPDPAGFLRGLHQDTALTDAKLGTLMGTWQVGLAMQAMSVGDWQHAKDLFHAVLANPPAGITMADLQEVAKVAAANGIALA